MTYSDGTNSGLSRRNHYVGQPAVKVGSSNFDYYRKPEKSHGFAKRVAFFAYFPLLILWLETDLKIAVHNRAFGGTCFVVFFFKTQRGKQRNCTRTHGCADDMVRCADDIL